MKEIKYTLSDTQRKFILQLHHMLNGYYVKGNNSYTTLIGFTIDMQDCIFLLNRILDTNYYTKVEKPLLNEIRSMYISLTHNVS